MSVIKKFHKKPSHVRKNNFCSKLCLEQWRGSKIETNCDYCNATITKVTSELRDHNFCNQTCFGNWHSESMRGENHPRFYLKEIPCDHCGNSFKPSLGTQRFCSVKCANTARETRISLVCDACKTEYSVQVGEAKWAEDRGYVHKFCSKKCQYGFQKKEGHPRWKKDRSDIKNQNKSLRETPEMKLWREEVFSRDNWTCQQCGDRSHAGHPVVLNAHHVKRIVDHPELSLIPSNGITLCEPCHKKTFGKEQLFEESFVRIITAKILP